MERFSYKQAAPDVYNTMLGVHHHLERCGLEDVLLNLVYFESAIGQRRRRPREIVKCCGSAA